MQIHPALILEPEENGGAQFLAAATTRLLDV